MLKKLKQKLKERAIRRRTRKALKNHVPKAYDKAEISWGAAEFMEHRRGLLWKISAILFVLLAAVFSYLFGDWTLSLVICVFAVVYYLTHYSKPPKKVEVILSQIGIKVGNRIYPFNHITGFWIFYSPPYLKTLNIRLNEGFFTDITIQMGEADPAKIREFLLKYVSELKDQKESFSEVLLRLFKI